MSAFQKTGLSPLRGVDALPEDTVGPYDAIMASCNVSGAALSDKVTIVSFIEDGVAQEVKRRVDIEAVAMTTEEDLQLCLKLSIQYHSMYVAACEYVLSRCNMLNQPLHRVLEAPLMIQMEKAWIRRTTLPLLLSV